MAVVRTIIVTVQNVGGANKYFLDGVQQATAYLGVGGSIRFDQSDASNGGGGTHPLRFSETSNGTWAGGSQYTTGVTTNGTPGQAGAYTEIEVTTSTPTTLYYYCTNHSGMGGAINITLNSWGSLTWNRGFWNAQNGISTDITGQQANSAIGSITVDAEIRAGWGRGAWNSAAWNQAPDQFIGITGQSVTTDIDVGKGWGREEWNSGAWNVGGGFVLVGSGSINSITGQSSNANVGSLSNVTGTSIITIDGNEVTISLNSVTLQGDVLIQPTGLEANTFIGTFSIAAGGAITIVTPGFDLSANVGNITTGTANLFEVDGQSLTTSSGTVNIDSGNIIQISGISANANVSSVILKIDQNFDITGIEATTSSASIIPNSQNFLEINGLQANITPTNLRFWDPITSNNSFTWTDI